MVKVVVDSGEAETRSAIIRYSSNRSLVDLVWSFADVARKEAVTKVWWDFDGGELWKSDLVSTCQSRERSERRTVPSLRRRLRN